MLGGRLVVMVCDLGRGGGGGGYRIYTREVG